jgi:hypothetical protein
LWIGRDNLRLGGEQLDLQAVVMDLRRCRRRGVG